MQAVCAFTNEGIDDNNKNAKTIQNELILLMRDKYDGMRGQLSAACPGRPPGHRLPMHPPIEGPDGKHRQGLAR